MVGSEPRSWKALATFTEGIKLLDAYKSTRDTKLLEGAEKQLSSASQIDPSYRNASFYLGVTTEMLGKHASAAKQFEYLLASAQEPDIELLYNLGVAYFHHYHPAAYEKAVPHLKNVIKLAEQKQPPTKEHLQRWKPIGLLSQSVLAQVYAHMTILTEPEPTPEFVEAAKNYYRLAHKEALQALDKLKGLQGHLDVDTVSEIGWGAHNACGIAKMYKGRGAGEVALLKEAISDFQEALRYSPNNIRPLGNIGTANLFLAKLSRERDPQESAAYLEKAKETFEHVLEIQPKYDFAYSRMAQISSEMGEYTAAEFFVNEAERNPSEMTPAYIKQLRAKIRAARER